MGFRDVGKDLLSQRALLKRVDTKFILRKEQLEKVLALTKPHFGLLRAGTQAVAQYRTLYFDSDDYLCLREHHRGRRPRHKIRIRHYLDRKLSFLEVKRKTSADQTVKVRQPLSFMAEQLGAEEKAFVDLHNPISASRLQPSLRTDFDRITLVGVDTVERATFDVHLNVKGEDGQAELPQLVIAEIKQERFMPRSPLMMAFRHAGLRPTSLSKYCAAGLLLLESVPMPRYRRLLRSIRKQSEIRMHVND